VRLEEILAPVSKDLEAVESRLGDWTEGEMPIVSDAVGHVLRSGGIRLRAGCLLLAAGLGDPGEHRIALAGAIEIIRAASLVRDDIISGAPVRRGLPTLEPRWGLPVIYALQHDRMCGRGVVSARFSERDEDQMRVELGRLPAAAAQAERAAVEPE
jgi:geranylgeranyl pyrophosphate synthase